MKLHRKIVGQEHWGFVRAWVSEEDIRAEKELLEYYMNEPEYTEIKEELC